MRGLLSASTKLQPPHGPRTAARHARQRADSAVFQETPIFSRLVDERGDIPAQVRGEAERIRRDLDQVMRRSPGLNPSAPLDLPGPKAPSSGL